MLSQEIEDCFGRGTLNCNDYTKRVLRLEEASNETPMPLSYDPLPGTSYNYARADHSHLLPEEIEKAVRDHNGNIIHEYYAPIDSPNFTGEPMAPTPELGDDSNRIATTEYVNNKVDSIDAMLYMGIVNDTSDLPSEHVLGWMFRVGTAGTYAGKECEVGDMIICNTTGTTFDPTHWDVILANIDGAVVGPATSVDGNIVIYDGASGKVVKDSGVNIDDVYLKDDVDEIVNCVNETIENNELVTSAALNDLNDRIIQLGELLEEYSTESETNLNNAKSELNTRIDEISTTIDENELTVSSALNDLNSRVSSNVDSINSITENTLPTVVINVPSTLIDSKVSGLEIKDYVTYEVIEGTLTADNYKYARYLVKNPYNSATEDLYDDYYIRIPEIEFDNGTDYLNMNFTILTNASGFYKVWGGRVEADNLDLFVTNVNNKTQMYAWVTLSLEIPNSTLNYVTLLVYSDLLTQNSLLADSEIVSNLDYPLAPYNYIINLRIVKSTQNNGLYDMYTMCLVNKTYNTIVDDVTHYYSEFEYENKIYTFEWIKQTNTRVSPPYDYWGFKITNITNV